MPFVSARPQSGEGHLLCQGSAHTKIKTTILTQLCSHETSHFLLIAIFFRNNVLPSHHLPTVLYSSIMYIAYRNAVWKLRHANSIAVEGCGTSSQKTSAHVQQRHAITTTIHVAVEAAHMSTYFIQRVLIL